MRVNMSLRTVTRWLRHGALMGLAVTSVLAARVQTAFAGDEKPRPAVIHFADLGAIRDWRADGADALLVQSSRGQWYRATFYGPCIGLQFADTIGFVTDPGGSLDVFSSVLVNGDRCWFRTFDQVSLPEEGGGD